MPTVEREVRYIGEENPLRLRLVEASGAPIEISNIAITFYSSSAAEVESYNNIDHPERFTFDGAVLSFLWHVDGTKYSPGQYYAYWRFVVDGALPETYIKRVPIEVRAVPDTSG